MFACLKSKVYIHVLAYLCGFNVTANVKGNHKAIRKNLVRRFNLEVMYKGRLVPRPICGRGENGLVSIVCSLFARNIPFIQRIFSSIIL